ncbi:MULTISPECIES: PEP/pyruvate-binding domain-containing protein [unclassified Microbacterium]|uniref:PEP/pyruvate-binding domain-containing protein n=1 Tax=unclassified Microbacterium TaxID=2609290 RepID=UPI00217D0FB7|nr:MULTISPECIES: PEP/pyruvate-binding domain-containing protein [unclassified Microbacterium]
MPDGFVVPHDGEHAAGMEVTEFLRVEVARELARMGDPVVAVRSSAMNEDTADASAAGQYESVIGARGTAEVCDAIVACWSSADASRVGEYWNRATVGATPSAPGMAVLVQRVIEAEVSGVMFTPQRSGEPTRIEASWGLGLAVVGGTVAPDSYEVAADGSIRYSVGSKQTRIDLNVARGGVIASAVAAEEQQARSLDDGTVAILTGLGSRMAQIQGGPQDIEWAVADGAVWVLQARPVTASLPAVRAHGSPLPFRTLTGTPGSHGTVIGVARIVRGPSDFAAVQPGEIVVCPYTDPAWTPLFTIAAGVVTEIGGALSHAAIVAREYGIPAVLGVPDALNLIENGRRIALDGTAGTITPL